MHVAGGPVARPHERQGVFDREDPNRIARFDATATWLDDLVPAFGEPEFFYETGLPRLMRRAHTLHPVDDGDGASARSAGL